MNIQPLFIFFFSIHPSPIIDFMSEKKESILSVVHPDELIAEEKNTTVHDYTQIHDEDNVHDDAKKIEQVDPDILSENKVNVEIVPDVKSNQVMVQLCSMSLFCCLWTTGK